jgi:group I intron endonuclease
MSIIYKTTNTKNGKIYIGKSSIDNPLYLGSGVILAQAIEKYGKQYFVREILEECDNSVVDSREIYWISLLQATDRNIGYNITKGGTGGDTVSNHPKKLDIVSKRNKSVKKWHDSLSDNEKAARGKKISDAKKGKSNGHLGYKHSEETKQRIKEGQPEKSHAWRKAQADAAAKRKGIPLTKKYKPVIVNAVEYPSIQHAMAALGIKHRATFYDRISRNIINVKYI